MICLIYVNNVTIKYVRIFIHLSLLFYIWKLLLISQLISVTISHIWCHLFSDTLSKQTGREPENIGEMLLLAKLLSTSTVHPYQYGKAANLNDYSADGTVFDYMAGVRKVLLTFIQHDELDFAFSPFWTHGIIVLRKLILLFNENFSCWSLAPLQIYFSHIMEASSSYHVPSCHNYLTSTKCFCFYTSNWQLSPHETGHWQVIMSKLYKHLYYWARVRSIYYDCFFSAFCNWFRYVAHGLWIVIFIFRFHFHLP